MSDIKTDNSMTLVNALRRIDELERELESVKASANGEVEPVAFAISDTEGKVRPLSAFYVHEKLADKHIEGYEQQATLHKVPLYTHPPAKVPEGLIDAVQNLGPFEKDFGANFNDEFGVYHCNYCNARYEQDLCEKPELDHAEDCPVVKLRQLLTTPTPAATAETENAERLKAVNKAQAQTISELDALVHAFRKSLRDLLLLVKLPPLGDPDREVCKEGLELAEDLISGAEIPITTAEAEWVKCEDRLPTQTDGDERCSLWVSGLYENTGNRFVMMAFVGEAIDLAKTCGIDYFMPTGLKRPQPPQEQ